MLIVIAPATSYMCGNAGEHGFLTAKPHSLQAFSNGSDSIEGSWLCLRQDVSLGESLQACWSKRAANATEAASHAAPQPCPALQRYQQKYPVAPALQALPLSMLLTHSAQACLMRLKFFGGAEQGVPSAHPCMQCRSFSCC